MNNRIIYYLGILSMCLLISACGWMVFAVMEDAEAHPEGVLDRTDGVADDNLFTEEMMEYDIPYIASMGDSSLPDKENSLEGEQEGMSIESMATMENIKSYAAGTVLEGTEGYSDKMIDSLFFINEITEEIKARIIGKSYGKDCDIPFSKLRYLRLLHVDFEGHTRIGELIVNKAIAEDTIDIFKELYRNGYPIEIMVLVDEYNAEDIASMEANNTSAFNYRNIDGTNKLSNHSLGLAIDINPLYNPYVRSINGKTVVLPGNGEEYADRSRDCLYYIKASDICYEAFIKRGFTWGGDWKNSKDYQHFEKRID